MKDTRLLHLASAIEAALEIGSELAAEGITNVGEAARLDMAGRRLVEARSAVLSIYEAES